MSKRTKVTRTLQHGAEPSRVWMGGLFFAAGILAIVGLILFTRQTEAAPIQTFADLGNNHIPDHPEEYLWNSRPPTSGPHLGGLASWGVHTESVKEALQVHNLEDGGVIVHYNCPEGCPDIVADLTEIMNESGRQHLILHPYPDMDSKIALTAWTKLLELDRVDRKAILDFIEKYEGLDHHR